MLVGANGKSHQKRATSKQNWNPKLSTNSMALVSPRPSQLTRLVKQRLNPIRPIRLRPDPTR